MRLALACFEVEIPFDTWSAKRLEGVSEGEVIFSYRYSSIH